MTMQPNGASVIEQLAAALAELAAGHDALARRVRDQVVARLREHDGELDVLAERVSALELEIHRLEDELRDYRAALAAATRREPA